MFQSTVEEQEIASEGCVECGGSRIIERVRQQTFPYLSGGKQVDITASIPIFVCEDCGYAFFGQRGEEARQNAICRFLGVQTPKEIEQVREAAGLARAQFCEISGFGIASLQRWESGATTQSLSSDRLIYLLRFPENLERLRQRNAAGFDVPRTSDRMVTSVIDVPEAQTPHAKKRFPRLRSQPRVYQSAAVFSLRKAQCM